MAKKEKLIEKYTKQYSKYMRKAIKYNNKAYVAAVKRTFLLTDGKMNVLNLAGLKKEIIN